MSDEFDVLNELRMMQKQMNSMFAMALTNKKDQNLLDAHNKAVEARQKAKDGRIGTKATFEETYVIGQKQTNDYLSRLLKTTDSARDRERNTSLNPTDSKFSMNPLNVLNNIGKLVEKDQGQRGVISSALRLPAGIVNFSKDLLRKKELKKIDSSRKDFNVNKELFDARNAELGKLITQTKGRPKTEAENAAFESLTKSISSLKSSLDKKATDLATQVEKQQRKEEFNLDSKRFSGLSKDEIASIRNNERDRIKQSFLSDMDAKSNRENSRRVATERQRRPTPSVVANIVNPMGQVGAKVASTKKSLLDGGSIEDRILNKKVSVSPASPSTFGDVVGGIYYRLGTLIENFKSKPEQQSSKEEGGFLSSLLGMAAGFLLPKLASLLKAFSALRAGLGGAFKVFGKLGPALKSFGGMIADAGKSVFKFFGKDGAKDAAKTAAKGAGKSAAAKTATTVAGDVAKAGAKAVPKAAQTAASTGIKVAAGEGVKGGAKIGAKLAGKEALAIGGKTVGKSLAKKIPFIGAGAGALFAAQRAMGGDFKGAGLELASGATSFLPGAGTVAGLGIDAYLLKRDLDRNRAKNEENTPVQEKAEASPILQNQSEVDRTKTMADQAKLQEEAMYRALKRFGKEDMETNEPTRARINANAILNAGSM